MIRSNVKDTLFLYLGVSQLAISAVIVKDVENEYRPIYYISKALQGAEIRYSTLEKLGYTMIVAVRKMKPYFQTHLVVVFTNQALK